MDSDSGWQGHRDQQADCWDGSVHLKIKRITATKSSARPFRLVAKLM
jgi:hypothetical protein